MSRYIQTCSMAGKRNEMIPVLLIKFHLMGVSPCTVGTHCLFHKDTHTQMPMITQSKSGRSCIPFNLWVYSSCVLTYIFCNFAGLLTGHRSRLSMPFLWHFNGKVGTSMSNIPSSLSTISRTHKSGSKGTPIPANSAANCVCMRLFSLRL